MTADSIIDDLYRYNDWANQKIFGLCDGLSDDQLDEPREMGFGSLRNTIFHILAAEETWIERWQQLPPRPFETHSNGLPLDDVEQRLQTVSQRRQELINSDRSNRWQTICHYKDSRGNDYANTLASLLLHVANHGVYHRAQALSYLKKFDRKIAGGIDYLFFRIGNPLIKLPQETIALMSKLGMEVDQGEGAIVTMDDQMTSAMFAYGDWANQQLVTLALDLEDAQLDRDFGIGLGTIRKTILHIYDAENWWLKNWTEGTCPFERLPQATSVTSLQSLWQAHIARRNSFLRALSSESAFRIVVALIGKMQIRLSIIESLIQLFTHGTHHRAQLTNMLRHVGRKPPPTDFVVYARQAASQ